VEFEFYRLRFHLTAIGAIHFPSGHSGNILRGALGTILKDKPAAYADVFAPRVGQAFSRSPSGLADWPRPFVFRASHLDGAVIHPTEHFHFEVNLFQAKEPPISDFVDAFTEVANRGFGPGRGAAALSSVDQDQARIVLDAPSHAISHLQLHFRTPTELKATNGLAPKPDFAILLARIRDRISTLRALYGSGPLEIDFAAFGDRAAQIRMTRCEIEMRHATRRSTRTGQRHPLGGFVGVAEYEGDLTEFLPYLTAAQHTGVGRQTTWGKGEISVLSSS